MECLGLGYEGIACRVGVTAGIAASRGCTLGAWMFFRSLSLSSRTCSASRAACWLAVVSSGTVLYTARRVSEHTKRQGIHSIPGDAHPQVLIQRPPVLLVVNDVSPSRRCLFDLPLLHRSLRPRMATCTVDFCGQSVPEALSALPVPLRGGPTGRLPVGGRSVRGRLSGRRLWLPVRDLCLPYLIATRKSSRMQHTQQCMRTLHQADQSDITSPSPNTSQNA